jgi:alginate production protein
MPFKDHRTWWYDNELDAIKLSHYETLLSWDILAGGRFSDNRISSSDQRVGLEDIRYLVSHIDYHYYFNHHIEFFGIYEDSDKEDLYKDHKLGWLGMRTYGKSTNIEYWTDFAFMSGDIGYIDEASYSASGYGLDLGAIYRTNAISFGVDIAYGSADISDEEDSKKLYLQPKISNNKSSIIGTTRYRYYGELADPQLSNLKIISLFAGSKIFSNNWIEVAYHYYQQNEADTNFESSRFLVKPNGESADIGTEFDVILGGKYDNKSELQLVFSSFTAGDAFEGVAIEKEAYRAHIDYKLYW